MGLSDSLAMSATTACSKVNFAATRLGVSDPLAVGGRDGPAIVIPDFLQ